MKSTFSMIFYLKRLVVKNDGTQTQFSCKITTAPKIWDTKNGRATGRITVALEANRMLDDIYMCIRQHYQAGPTLPPRKWRMPFYV